MAKGIRFGITAGLIVANAFVLGGTGFSLWKSLQQHEARAQILTQNMVLAVDKSVSNLIARVDLVLGAAIDELEQRLAKGQIDEPSMNAFLARQEKRVPELEAIRVAAADGTVILGKGLDRKQRPSWADRDYFMYLRDHENAPLIMSPPRMGRVAKSVIVGFQRRYNYPDGRFAGVISAPVSIEHFERLLSHFDLGAKGSLVIRDADLGLIARHPPLRGKTAGTIGNADVSEELRELMRGSQDFATYFTPSASDRLARIISYRRSATPRFIVLAGMASDDYLAGWRSEVYVGGALAAGFALISLLYGLLLFRWSKAMLEREAANQKLADGEAQLKAIVEAEPECVKMLALDGTLRQMNRAGLDMIEAESFEQVAGARVVDLVTEPHRAAFTALGEDVARGKSGVLEFEIVGLKGTHRWLETHAVPLRGPQGDVEALLAVTRDVTERRRIELTLRERERHLSEMAARVEDKNRLVEIVSRMQDHFIRNPDPVVMYRQLVEDILSLTDSEFGFIGDVLQDNDGRDYLRIYAFKGATGDDASQLRFDAPENTGFVFRDLDNLFGRVINERKFIVAASVATDSRVGLPPGHPEVKDFLGVPVWHGDRLVGEVGLANRAGGYDSQLVDYLQPVMEALGGIIVARWESEARAKAEQLLRESEEKYRELVVNANAIILRMASDGTVTYFNEFAERLFGYAAEEIIGRHVVGTIVPEYESNTGRDLAALMAEVLANPEQYQDNENENVTRDGRRVYIHWTNRIIRDANGHATGVLSIGNDVTARKAAEDAMRQRERELSAIVENLPLMVFVKDAENLRFVRFNRAGEELLGHTRDELLGKNDYDFFPPERADFFTAKDREVLAHRGVTDVAEEPIETPRGTRLLHTRKVSILGADGRPIFLLGISEDITERKTIEAELIKAKEVAESANTAKSRFLATMSHEIRTPMNGVLGMAQLLLLPNLGESERQDYARIIINSGQTLLTLLNDILDLSKIEAGKVELRQSVFRSEQLIKETAALFEEVAESKGIRLETAWHGKSNARYRADPNRLRQMLSNFVGNAIKFTSQGFVRIEGEELESADDEALLQFSVTDSGIGVSEDKQALLFKPFSQVVTTTASEYGGTGLGLSIVRNLALLMRGDVGVESGEGKGSKFWFRIRAERVGESADSRQGPRNAETAANRGGVKQLVLVVEDNMTNRVVLESFLRKQNLHFESVQNGKEAVERITTGMHPDLVLMDCQMPVMDGYEATKEIRKWEQANGKPHLPIIALTAGAYEEDRQHCLAAGMDDFLSKPVDFKGLAAIIAQWGKRRGV